MSKPEVEVVVKLEVEEVEPCSGILIRWQRTIIGYMFRAVGKPMRESVFDDPESVIEAQVEDQTHS